MREGNILKLKGGSIVIVYRVDDKLTHWISFDSSGCSGGTKNVTTIIDSMCWTCDINDGGDPDYDCSDCKGTGTYKEEIPGIDKATLLADNVKSYILKSITKNFDF